MLNIGPGELVLIFLVGLLVLGPQKLPEAARQVGRAMAELRRLSSGFQAELKSAMDEPTIERSPTPLATPAPTTPTEEMNAALAKARDEAIAAAEAGSRDGNDGEAVVPATRSMKKAPATKKKAAATKKKAAPKQAAAAKKTTAKKKTAPPKKAAATKKR